MHKFIFLFLNKLPAMSKKSLLVPVLIIVTTCLNAQLEESSFSATGRGGTATSFVTDYQALGINPANLGFNTDHTFALGFGEVGYGFYSEALVRDDIRAIIFNNEDSLSNEEQETLARAFLNEGLTFNVDILLGGISLRIPKLGTLAFGVKSNIAYRTKFAGQAANIIFEGYNYEDYIDTIVFTGTEIYGVAFEPLSLSELFEDTELLLNIGSEINLAYGRKIFGNDSLFSLYGGFGVKYIMSYAYLDISSENGNLTGQSALGFDILDLQSFETSSPIISSKLEPVGKGFGYDVGLSMKVADVFTFGAAITDIGSVVYTANILEIHDFVLDTIRFNGVSTTDPLALISQIFDEENLIEYTGASEFTVSLPTKLRVGGSLKLNNILDVGADAIFPLNTVAGSLGSPILGIGADLRVLKVIKLSAGMSSGGGYAVNFPAGIGFDFKIWELGFATRDILTWFGAPSPTVSFAAGVLRFKI